MGGINICIPTMLGQVGKCSIEIQLLQMCYSDPSGPLILQTRGNVILGNDVLVLPVGSRDLPCPLRKHSKMFAGV
jgi:hypothetical protein